MVVVAVTVVVDPMGKVRETDPADVFFLECQTPGTFVGFHDQNLTCAYFF